MGDDLAPYFKIKLDEGALILEVEGKSPAEKAGLKPGDVIVLIGKDKVFQASDVSDIIKDLKPGDDVDIAVIRQGREIPLKARLESGEVKIFDRFEMPCLPSIPGCISPECNIQIRTGDETGDLEISGLDNLNEKLKDRMKEIQIQCQKAGEKMQSKAEDIQRRLETDLKGIIEEQASI